MSGERLSCETGFVLNITKPEGWTSHDAVARVRRLLRYRKVGHTGTLDPFATGVLLCCVGRATKISRYLMELTKEYAGTLVLGRRTSSGDRAGEVLSDEEPPALGEEQLVAEAQRLTGEIEQVPPMVSALKHDGRRLYQLARQGITVERQPRRVFVEAFTILSRRGRQVDFRVRCARGTYVRTLVEDFGTALGTQACVDSLCRTRVGRFRVEDAISVEEPTPEEGLLPHAIQMGAALEHLPDWSVPPFWVHKLRSGQAPPWVVLKLSATPQAGEIGRLLGAGGELLALGRARPTPGRADRDWYDALEVELLRVI